MASSAERDHHIADRQLVVARVALLDDAHDVIAVQIRACDQPFQARHLADDEQHAYALIDHELLGLAQRRRRAGRRRLDLRRSVMTDERRRLQGHRFGLPGLRLRDERRVLQAARRQRRVSVHVDLLGRARDRRPASTTVRANSRRRHSGAVMSGWPARASLATPSRHERRAAAGRLPLSERRRRGMQARRRSDELGEPLQVDVAAADR